jgi:hypothetical protein
MARFILAETVPFMEIVTVQPTSLIVMSGMLIASYFKGGYKTYGGFVDGRPGSEPSPLLGCEVPGTPTFGPDFAFSDQGHCDEGEAGTAQSPLDSSSEGSTLQGGREDAGFRGGISIGRLIQRPTKILDGSLIPFARAINFHFFGSEYSFRAMLQRLSPAWIKCGFIA